MIDILLLGSGGHSRSCADVIEAGGVYKIAGIVVPVISMDVGFYEYKIVGTDSDLKVLLEKVPRALVAVGQIKSSEARYNLFHLLKKYGAELPVVKSPFAYCSKRAIVLEGSILMHGAIVNGGAFIGENCIINTRAFVEHDAYIGMHSHVATGACVNGGVRVGDRCFIGSGATLREGIEIGDDSIIGAGVYLSSNIPAGSVIRRANDK